MPLPVRWSRTSTSGRFRRSNAQQTPEFRVPCAKCSGAGPDGYALSHRRQTESRHRLRVRSFASHQGLRGLQRPGRPQSVSQWNRPSRVRRRGAVDGRVQPGHEYPDRLRRCSARRRHRGSATRSRRDKAFVGRVPRQGGPPQGYQERRTDASTVQTITGATISSRTVIQIIDQRGRALAAAAAGL